MPAGEFFFLSYAEPGCEKDPVFKQQVWSHSMKGKNSRSDSRRSLRRARREAREGAQQSSTTGSGIARDENRDGDDDDAVEMVDLVPLHRRVQDVCRQWWYQSNRIPSALESPVQLDPLSMRFAHRNRKTPQEMLQLRSAFDYISRSSYHMQSFVDCESEVFHRFPAVDELLLPSMVYLASVAIDVGRERRELDAATLSYLAGSLRMINQGITARNAHLQDSIVYSIVFQILSASCMGDQVAFQSHMAGLKKIMNLRGFGKGSTWLQFKLQRLDLIWVLQSQGTPFFLPDEPLQLDEEQAGEEFPYGSRIWLANFLDPNLRILFGQLRKLATMANELSVNSTKLSLSDFQAVFVPILSRLVHIQRTATDILDEWFCLGMLFFVNTLMKVPHVQATWPHTSERLRAATERLRLRSEIFASSGIAAWVLVLAATEVVHPKEPWLREAWRDLVGSELAWEKVRQDLHHVLWIGCIHDRMAASEFHVLNRKEA